MRRMLSQLLRTDVVCGVLMVMNPFISLTVIGPGFTAGAYVATITSESMNINRSQDSEEVLMTTQVGSTYKILEDLGNGWMKIRVNDTEGYLPVPGNVTVEEVAADRMAEVQQDTLESPNSYKRRQVVNYATQFIGGGCRYGDGDPRIGMDCSGFTRYVLQNSTGISMNRPSGERAQQDVAVEADQMQPGDLLFYDSTRGINHVAMYIGNGRIIHASTERTGITVSNWNYRSPVKIVNVLG